MNKNLIRVAVLAVLLPVYALGQEQAIISKAAHITPSVRQLHWQQLELTAFFHFGINTFTGKEWGDGKEDISQFNPRQLDAGQWVKTMKDAGFKQVILTAKHHDGFCLWPSKYTGHSIRNTPYKQGKGDIVREVAGACKKYGVGFGIYLSPWDRNALFYGDSARYNAYFLHQLTELLTNYGRVDEVWFDGANGEGPNGKVEVYDFTSWYKLIRRLQPQAVIAVMGPDVRWVGTETGVGRETEWSVLPVDEQTQESVAAGSQKDVLVMPRITGNHTDEDLGGRSRIMGTKDLVWYPAETDVSIRPGWFYHPEQDDKVKSPEHLMETYFTSVGRNGVLLLNVPPDKSGRISASDVNSLRGFGNLLKATFAENLAKRAVIRTANGIYTRRLTDGKMTTFFTTSDHDTTALIHIDFSSPQTFDILSLQENISVGQRIEKFSGEYFDGRQWKQFVEGTTVGYKRLLRFDAITAQKVRLNILSSRLNPTLSEVGVYRSAGSSLTSRADRYAGEWFATPMHIPHPLTPDAPVAGSGDVGVVYAGAPERQQFYFSKNDFWKAQLGYPNGGVCLAGGLTLVADELKGASVYMKQQIENGLISSVYKTSALTFRQQSWVYAKSNLVVITLSVDGKSTPVHLSLWADDKFGATVKSGSDGEIRWITRSFDYLGLEWPSHVGIAMRVLGGAGESFLLKPGVPVTVVVALKSNHDTTGYLKACIRDLKRFQRSETNNMWKRHVQWWNAFWSQSSVVLGDPLLEKYYYGSQYLLASCSRSGHVAPGLWGNSLTMDANRGWQGDYHTNYNYEAPWWGAYSSNHLAITDPYEAPILSYMSKAERHARKYLGIKGVYYPVGIGPWGFCSSRYPLTRKDMMNCFPDGGGDSTIEDGYMFLGQKSNALFLTSNMFMRFFLTYDSSYARKIYPFLRQVSLFWEAYLKYENGRYVDYNDNFWEVGPWEGKGWQEHYGDVNPTITLGLLRMFYKGILDISAFLGKDADKRKQWSFILAHLSRIPLDTTDGVIRVKACEGGKGSGSKAPAGFGRVMMQGLVYPAGVCGTQTDSAFAALLCKEIDRFGQSPRGDADWFNPDNGLETYFTAAARLGYDPGKIIGVLKDRIRAKGLRNLWLPQTGGGIETLSAVPSCMNEMLLQGYEGVVRVFPNWPMQNDASFDHLRTYGAFLVSSALKGGVVQWVRLHSEKGRDCVMENPWPQRDIIMTSSSGYRKILKGRMVRFHSKRGEEIELRDGGQRFSIKRQQF